MQDYPSVMNSFIEKAKQLQTPKSVHATNCCGKELETLLLQADAGEYGTAFQGCIHDIGALSALAMYQSGLITEEQLDENSTFTFKDS